VAFIPKRFALLTRLLHTFPFSGVEETRTPIFSISYDGYLHNGPGSTVRVFHFWLPDALTGSLRPRQEKKRNVEQRAAARCSTFLFFSLVGQIVSEKWKALA
jgi:hypothetical protein